MFRIRCLQQEQLSIRVGVSTWIEARAATLSTGYFCLGRGGFEAGSLIWLEHNLFVSLVCLFVSFFSISL